ncbi:hypothetical protein T484DRAFT_1756352 [Baffinella frigidus]|nr:hypothetical protein T484DRAFT_1756352 [Cryptophyta sp. CCMP2293]
MSRAPAPLKIEPTASTADMPMTNPYSMQTYGMPGCMNGSQMMGPVTNSPLHTMQSMYGNTHMQAPMAPHGAQLNSPAYMHGMQPSTMQNVSVVDFKPDTMANSQIAQMHQQYQNQLNTMTAAPGLGLIGHDGQYIPATAATPYGSVYHDSHMTNAPYHPRGLHDDVHPMANGRYSQRDNSHHMPMSSNGYGGGNGTSYPSSVDHIDNTSGRAIKDMIEDSVERAVSSAASAAASASNTKRSFNTDSDESFHTKPAHEQRHIVGQAVRSVMSEFKRGDRSRDTSDSFDSRYD